MHESIYQEAGMGNAVGFGDRAAVVVVDVQRAFTDPDSPLGADLDDTVAEIASLLDAVDQTGIPLIGVVSEYTEGFEGAAYFGHKVDTSDILLVDSKWVDLDSRLPADRLKRVVKQQPSAFFGTELDTILTYQRVDTVIVTGVTTSGCVRATVVDAVSHGYRVIVPEECVGDRARDPHEANLFDMDAKYADVLSAEEVQAALARQSRGRDEEP